MDIQIDNTGKFTVESDPTVTVVNRIGDYELPATYDFSELPPKLHGLALQLILSHGMFHLALPSRERNASCQTKEKAETKNKRSGWFDSLSSLPRTLKSRLQSGTKR